MAPGTLRFLALAAASVLVAGVEPGDLLHGVDEPAEGPISAAESAEMTAKIKKVKDEGVFAEYKAQWGDFKIPSEKDLKKVRKVVAKNPKKAPRAIRKAFELGGDRAQKALVQQILADIKDEKTDDGKKGKSWKKAKKSRRGKKGKKGSTLADKLDKGWGNKPWRSLLAEGSELQQEQVYQPEAGKAGGDPTSMQHEEDMMEKAGAAAEAYVKKLHLTPEQQKAADAAEKKEELVPPQRKQPPQPLP